MYLQRVEADGRSDFVVDTGRHPSCPSVLRGVPALSRLSLPPETRYVQELAL